MDGAALYISMALSFIQQLNATPSTLAQTATLL
jgi:Na+/H+-dicarboxylate symporter